MSSILTSLKVTGAVSVGTSGTYTAPSSGYAVVTVSAPSTTTPATFTIASRTMTVPIGYSGGQCGTVVVWVGPSQQLAMGSATVGAGVEFSNS